MYRLSCEYREKLPIFLVIPPFFESYILNVARDYLRVKFRPPLDFPFTFFNF